MKKWLITIFVFLLAILSAIYFFIPDYISINPNVSVVAQQKGLNRLLMNENDWVKWWPEKTANVTNEPQKRYAYNSHTYSITDKMLTSFIVFITGKGRETKTSLNILPALQDTVTVEWVAVIPTSYNPVKRVQAYLYSRRLHDDMDVILGKMRSFFSDQKNIYGLNIQQVAVVDSALISTYAISQGYPSTVYIYSLINRLKKYIVTQSATETGCPMLNINTNDSVHFLTRVAIPVNKRLRDSGNITYKWMLGGGDILVAVVKGGPAAIQKAFAQMENYVNDYSLTAPAIPFQSLVTDRLKVPDSTKWITKIYYPIM